MDSRGRRNKGQVSQLSDLAGSSRGASGECVRVPVFYPEQLGTAYTECAVDEQVGPKLSIQRVMKDGIVKEGLSRLRVSTKPEDYTAVVIVPAVLPADILLQLGGGIYLQPKEPAGRISISRRISSLEQRISTLESQVEELLAVITEKDCQIQQTATTNRSQVEEELEKNRQIQLTATTPMSPVADQRAIIGEKDRKIQQLVVENMHEMHVRKLIKRAHKNLRFLLNIKKTEGEIWGEVVHTMTEDQWMEARLHGAARQILMESAFHVDDMWTSTDKDMAKALVHRFVNKGNTEMDRGWDEVFKLATGSKKSYEEFIGTRFAG